MRVKEAIILAGGLGTRLREAVPDLPKCMAPVNGKPFIWFVIDHLQKQGIERFIFSLGYRSEAFTGFLQQTLSPDAYEQIIEKEPLGTGGAVQLACSYAKDRDVLVTNGDSIFKINLQQQANLHEANQADCTLALKYLENFDRYGAVVLDGKGRIISFEEKRYYEHGFINGGVYLLNRESFLAEGLPEKFPFETGYLQALFNDRTMMGLPQDGYFIDIGIPEDYRKAQQDLNY